MRIFAISDLHIDYQANNRWLDSLSQNDYKADVLILAGDVSDNISALAQAFELLLSRFSKVLFVPGNHDLWVWRSDFSHSLQKFDAILSLAGAMGIHTQPMTIGHLTMIPLFSWYDFSFGQPVESLIKNWTDFSACRWPNGYSNADITKLFLSKNLAAVTPMPGEVITFSHFMPRIDLMPSAFPEHRKILFPVLGTSLLESQIRIINPRIHIYGHSHLNRQWVADGINYINNAFGYPYESKITRKELLCVYEL